MFKCTWIKCGAPNYKSFSNLSNTYMNLLYKLDQNDIAHRNLVQKIYRLLYFPMYQNMLYFA